MGPLSAILLSVHQQNPLVLHITNTVTINDCANISICFGASPVMSDDADDATKLMHKSQALLLNIGTINEYQMDVMWSATKRAMREEKPIVLDPVGVGSSKVRKSFANDLIEEFDISVIKGNAAEINMLSGASGDAHGVDSLGQVNIGKMMEFAELTGAVVVASGKVDLVTDGVHLFKVSNGVPEMGMVSGTGCMAGSCIAAATATGSRFTEASVVALAALGIAGERAAESATGPGTFKQAFFDEVAHMTPEIFDQYARVDEVKL